MGYAPPESQCEERCHKVIKWKYSDETIYNALRALLDDIWQDTPEADRPIYFMDIPPAPAYRGTGRGNLFQVAKSVDILAFASDFTTLRKAGPGKYKGPCPVHPFSERSSSFYIFTDKQTWRCFGACAAGGDVIALAGRLLDLGITV